MRRPAALFAALLAPALAMVPAAGCGTTGSAPDASTDGTIVLPGTDAGPDDAGADAEVRVVATMRLANMSPDLGPIDFCWRVTGAGSFTGPVLGGSLDAGVPVPPSRDAVSDTIGVTLDAGAAADGTVLDATDAARDSFEAADAADAGDSTHDAEDGLDDAPDGGQDGGSTSPEDAGSQGPEAGADGSESDASGGDAESDGEAGPPQVAFGNISVFKPIPAIGTLDIALVQAHQLSCTTTSYVGRVTLDPGKMTTVTVMGLLKADAGSNSALVMKAFVDEPASQQAASVRMIHAALGFPATDGPAPSLNVQAGSAWLAAEVDPANVASVSADPRVDTLGYAEAQALSSPAPIQFSAIGDAAPHTWSTPFFDLQLLPGTSHTGFIVNLGSGALGLAWCGVAQSGAAPGSCVLQAAR